jgi:hypothetical protein
MCPYLCAIESLVREIEAMTVSARTKQTDVHNYFCLRMLRLMLLQLQVLGQIKCVYLTEYSGR